MLIELCGMVHKPINDEDLYLEEEKIDVDVAACLILELCELPAECLVLFLLDIQERIAEILHDPLFRIEVNVDIPIKKAQNGK